MLVLSAVRPDATDVGNTVLQRRPVPGPAASRDLQGTLVDEIAVDAATATGAGAYNVLGLAGFDK